MLKLLSLVLISVISLFQATCNNVSNNKTKTKLNYLVPDYYFLKNTFYASTDSSVLIIKSYLSFDSLFHVAAVVGMDTSRLITEIKLVNSFIISIVYQGNNIHSYTIDSIYKKDDVLKIYYTSIITTPNATWTCNCFTNALLNNTDYNSIQLIENGNIRINPNIIIYK